MNPKSFIAVPVLFLSMLAICCVTLPAQHLETDRFAEIQEVVEKLAEQNSPDSILVVLDIDNTLLAMNQSLGSDQWFTWQESLITEQPGSRHLVAEDFSELLEAQGLLYSLSDMHPPEKEIPAIIEAIQQLGCSCLVLTSRGDDFRNATMRELEDNRYSFRDSSISIDEDVRGPFLPYDPDQPGQHGLSNEQAQALGSPREVSYAEGVFMVAGQHKGFMLKSLLARSDEEFRAIVFVDDHKKHTDRMREAFGHDLIVLYTVRYAGEDPEVKEFSDSDKREVTREWRRLSRAIDRVLVD